MVVVEAVPVLLDQMLLLVQEEVVVLDFIPVLQEHLLHTQEGVGVKVIVDMEMVLAVLAEEEAAVLVHQRIQAAAAGGRAMVGRVPAARVRLMPGQTVALVQPRVAPAVRIPVAAVVAAVGRDNPVARAAPALW